MQAYYEMLIKRSRLTETIEFEPQTATFVGGASKTASLEATPAGCAFSTADTLPSGVALSSAGVLTFDGSAVSTDSTTIIEVTASKAGCVSVTQTITIVLQGATMPTDARYELLLNNKTNTHFTGYTDNDDYLTTYPSNTYYYDTIGGVTGFRLKQGWTAWHMRYGATSQNANGNALSIWMRISGTIDKEGCLLNCSHTDQAPFAISIKKVNDEYRYHIVLKAGNAVKNLDTGIVATNKWHHYVVNYTPSTYGIEFWIDGVKEYSTTLDGAMSKYVGLTLHAMVPLNSSTPTGHFDKTVNYATYRWYNRKLTDAEIRGLSTELSPTN